MKITKEMVLASTNMCAEERKAFIEFDGTAMEYFRQDPRGNNAAAYVLKHTSSADIRNNHEFLSIAVAQNCLSLKSASEKLRVAPNLLFDRDFSLEAVKCYKGEY